MVSFSGCVSAVGQEGAASGPWGWPAVSHSWARTSRPSMVSVFVMNSTPMVEGDDRGAPPGTPLPSPQPSTGGKVGIGVKVMVRVRVAPPRRSRETRAGTRRAPPLKGH